MKTLRVRQKVKSVYKTSDGYFYGNIVSVINRKTPDPAISTRYVVKWNNGRTETLNSNRVEMVKDGRYED